MDDVPDRATPNDRRSGRSFRSRSRTSGRGVSVPAPMPVLPYEEQLERDTRWALSEGSRHFEGKGSVFQALQKIAKRLKDLG